MEKKKYIRMGIILLVFVFSFALLSYIPVIQLRIKGEEINPIIAFGFVLVGFTLTGIAEGFFIKAEIVPKWLKSIIYCQWFLVPVVMISTLICYFTIN